MREGRETMIFVARAPRPWFCSLFMGEAPMPPMMGFMSSEIASAHRDVRLLFATRIIRMAGYGGLAVILAVYLAQLGFSEKKIGLLLTLTLVGDTAISLWLTVIADRVGRRKVLVAGAALMVLAGV